jgi:acyl dehydratase
MLALQDPSELLDKVGAALGDSSWYDVSQERIIAFAEATEDRQWIHVDPERAAQGPFGGAIAHGFLSLSLLSAMSFEMLAIDHASMLINYGLNKVRFPSALPAGTRVRASGVVLSAEPVTGGVQAVLEMTLRRPDVDKPVCVAEWVVRAYGT